MVQSVGITDVDWVVETSGVRDVNNYLVDDEWVLLGTHLRSDELEQSRIYSLGRRRLNQHTPSEIVEVKECSAGLMAHDLSELNAYLAAGWTMLASFTRGDIQHGQDQIYSLAWYRSQGEPVHPEFEDGVARYLREAAEEESKGE